MTDASGSSVQEVTIKNRSGFHTRPVMKFVELAQTFESSIRVDVVGNHSAGADGKSAMDLMMLGATSGSKLRISADGPDAEPAVAALVKLVADRFDIEEQEPTEHS